MTMNSPYDTAEAVGCPIRKSSDQSLLAAPQGLTQPVTSFIASQCQGIHQMPFRHLITLNHTQGTKDGSDIRGQLSGIRSQIIGMTNNQSNPTHENSRIPQWPDKMIKLRRGLKTRASTDHRQDHRRNAHAIVRRLVSKEDMARRDNLRKNVN